MSAKRQPPPTAPSNSAPVAEDLDNLILAVSDLLERAQRNDPDDRIPPVAAQLANTLLRAYALRARLAGKRTDAAIWELVEQVNRVGSTTWPAQFVPVQRDQ